MEQTTMSYTQLLEAYRALQACVSALEGAAASGPLELPMASAHQTATAPDACLADGGEMGAAIRAFDWAQTPLGPVTSWSPSLRMMVRFLLANRFPLLLWWGPQ